MRICSLDSIQPGMFLADPVYLDDGRLLAAAGTALTADGLKILREQGFDSLVVHEEGTDDIEVPELISGELRRDAVVRTRRVFTHLRRRLAPLVDKPPSEILSALHGPKVQRDFVNLKIHQGLESIADGLLVELAGADSLDGLGAMRRVDELQVEHAINVAVASIALSFQIPLAGQRRSELAMGALLQDIGMLFVSPQVAQKEDTLTVAEMSRILAHPRLGYTLLQMTSSNLWFMSSHVVLQHHERQDGQGYPRGLFGTNRIGRSEHELFDAERIVLIAEIAGIAEAFEALGADRPYRKALAPEEVRAALRAMKGHHLNAEFVDAFLKLVPAFQTGSLVEVRAGDHVGCRGIVAKVDRNHLESPLIRILWDPDGNRKSPEDFDVAESDLGSRALRTVTDGDAIYRLDGLTRRTIVGIGIAPGLGEGEDGEFDDEHMLAFPAELLVPDDAVPGTTEQIEEALGRVSQAYEERPVLERMVPDRHPLRRLRDVLRSDAISARLQEHGLVNVSRELSDPEQMFRLYLLQTIYGYESEADLMVDVHVNMAFRWFCGFGISEELSDRRVISEFRNAIGHRLFISIANSLLAQADSVVEAVRPRRNTRRRAR